MKPEKIENIFKAIDGCQAAFMQLQSELNSGPAKYYFDKLKSYVDGCLSFSQYKTGDRVYLVKTIDFGNSPGWASCAHFLVLGAVGTVTSFDYFNDGIFRYGVTFDNESWKDKDGNVHPVDQRHVFSFKECDLSATDPTVNVIDLDVDFRRIELDLIKHENQQLSQENKQLRDQLSSLKKSLQILAE